MYFRTKGAPTRETGKSITRTVLVINPDLNEMISPTSNALEGLAAWSFNLILPPLTAVAASVRVLNKRTHHNHLSILLLASKAWQR